MFFTEKCPVLHLDWPHDVLEAPGGDLGVALGAARAGEGGAGPGGAGEQPPGAGPGPGQSSWGAEARATHLPSLLTGGPAPENNVHKAIVYKCSKFRKFGN